MPASIADIRKQYPEYQDLTDQQVADGLHAKFYADMPKEQFYSKIGLAGAQSHDNEPPLWAQTQEGLLKDGSTLADIIGMQEQGGTPAPVVRPSLADRFLANAGEAFNTGTLAGAATNTMPGEESAAAQRYADQPTIAASNAARISNVIAEARRGAAYRAMPDAQTPAEYGAAIGGGLVGGAASPENYIMPEGGMIYRALRGVAGKGVSRAVTRGVQVAAPNLATDPLIQATRMGAGLQDEYDPWRTAIGTATGFGIGAGASTMAQVVAKLRSSGAARTGIPQDKLQPGDLTADDIYSDDVLRILDANGALTPEQRMAFGQQVQEKLAARQAAAESQRQALVAQTSGIAPEMPVIAQTGADVQAALHPPADVIPLGKTAIADVADPAAQGNVAGADLRGRFQAPALVEGAAPAVPPAMTDEQVAIAAAKMRERTGAPIAEDAIPAPDKLLGAEDRLPQTRDQAVEQQQAGGAFDLAARQRERVEGQPNTLDPQAAGRPEGANPQQVVLDDGFPVQIISRRLVPDAKGNVVEVATVRRYDPRTGAAHGDAVEYDVPVRQLRASNYSQDPRLAQDFQNRAAGPVAPERPGMPGEGVRREPAQTFRQTAPDPNDRFPGGGSGGGEARGRSPLPQQPEGPHPGRARPRNEEEAIRDFEARQRAGERPDPAAGAKYKEGQFSTKAKGQGDDKAWHVDESGFVISDKGGPVRYADQKQAAKWILNVGHKDSPQHFEIANHPSGKGFTVRERGRTKPGDAAGGAGQTAGGGAAAREAGGSARPADATRALAAPEDTAAAGRDTRPPAGGGEAAAPTPAGEPRQTPPAGARLDADGRSLLSDAEIVAKHRDEIEVARGSDLAKRIELHDEGDIADYHRGFDSKLAGDPEPATVPRSPDAFRKGWWAAQDKIDNIANEVDDGIPPAMAAAPAEKVAAAAPGAKTEAPPAAAKVGPAKAPKVKDVPRSPAQAESALSRADAKRAEGAPLSKEQKAQAQAAKDETLGKLGAAESQATVTSDAMKKWRAKMDDAAPVGGDAGGRASRLERRGWDAAIAGDDKPPNMTTTEGKQSAQEGYDAGKAWLSANPKPAADIAVTMETARGQKTEVKLEPDAEKIADFAGRVSKLPIGRFYANPLDPELVKDLFGPLFGREAQRWADELGEVWRDLKGFDGKSILRGAGDFGRTLLYSNDGMLRSLANRFKDADGKSNRAIEHVANMFFAPVGDVDKTGVGRTYGEAVERRVQTAVNHLTDLLKPFNDYSLAQQRQVLEQITRLIVNGKVTENGSQVHKIAAEIQKELKGWLGYAREAGVDVGDVGARYFPRELAVEKVLTNPKGFLSRAAEAYRADGMDGAEAEAAAAAWFRRIQESDLGFRSDGNDFVQTGTGKTPKNEKGRALSLKAEKIMDDYYLRNVADVLPQYYLRMARRAEWVRRMGADLEKWKEMRQAIQDSGAGAAIPDVVRTIQSMTGATAAPVGSAARALLSAAKVVGVTTYLPRAVLSSLTEPVTIAMRSGNAGDAVRAYVQTAKDMVKEISGISLPGKRTEMAREIAEDLGLVTQIGDDMLMAQRFGGRVENKLARRITNQFFVRTGLHHFTEATRVAATSIGQTFMRRLSRSIENDGIYSQSSRFLMGELGIKDPEGFAKWVNGHANGMPRPDELAADNSAHAETYKDALYRFVSQSILKPGGEVKTRYANHPVGSLFYHLQSYNYAFQKNVLNRFGRLGVAAFRGKGMNVADRMRLMAPLAWYAAIGVPLQYAIGELRDIYQDDPGVDPALKQKSVSQETMRAISRAGLGAADLPVNIATGIKYARDPATVAAGPIIGGLLEAAKAGIELGGDQNSANTNTAERRATKYLYETVLKPIMVSALSLAPGKIGQALSIPGIQYVALPSARDKVVTAVAGKPSFRDGRQSSRGGKARGSARTSSR